MTLAERLQALQEAFTGKSAEAEAKATEAVSKAVAGGNVQALNYFIAQKYVEAMSQIGKAPNSRLVLMPMEASGLIGTIAGIAELAKNGAISPPSGAGGTPAPWGQGTGQ